MKYKDIIKGKFIRRINRFIAEIEIEGGIEECHVRNTGRCKELFIEGAEVYLEKCNKIERKTKFSLIAVVKNGIIINIDSMAPNKAIWEWLNDKDKCIFDDITYMRSEMKFGKSRFDFYMERKDRKCFIEVKGVTLEKDGVVSFPDAPTDRGRKHVLELIEAKEKGYDAYLIFVIQLKGAKWFEPNEVNDKPFAEALRKAKEMGVNILAYDCIIKKDEIKIDRKIQVKI